MYLHDNDFYKSVMIYKINCIRAVDESSVKMKSPVYIVIQSVKKYGLYDIILDYIDKNAFGNVIVWKKCVKETICDLEIIRWKVACSIICILN